MNDDEAWSIVERKETISNHRSTLVFCDRRDQCFVIRNGKVRRDLISHRRSRSFDTFPTGIETTSNDAKPVDELRENLFFPSSKIFLERIQYFQRNSTKKHLTELKIFYQPNNARSEYLCQSISFQFNKSGKKSVSTIRLEQNEFRLFRRRNFAVARSDELGRRIGEEFVGTGKTKPVRSRRKFSFSL